MPKPATRIATILDQLDQQNRDSLLAFAEFLLERQGPLSEPVPSSPLAIPRPSEETVVAALRRLRETYPMVNRTLIFSRSSELMTAHIVEGREATAVIDELESLFAQHYEDGQPLDPTTDDTPS